MTEAQRKRAHARVMKLGDDARYLAVWGRALTPTDVGRLVAKLADELAKVLEPPRRQKRGT